MSDFRTRLLGLAAVATAFAGVSYGQIACPTTSAQTNPSLRAEGETELLAEYVVQCNNAGAATSGTVYLTTSLPITSKAITVAGAPSNEATLTVTGGIVVQATVSGTQAAFLLTAGQIPAGAFTLTFDDIRVNASTGGAPQVAEGGVISTALGGVSSNTALPAAPGPGYILTSLGSPTSLLAMGTINYTTCGGNAGIPGFAAAGTSFTVTIKELVGGAFKTSGSAATGGEGGTLVGANGIGTATTATQLTVTLGNVPASATVYVPSLVTAGGVAAGAGVTELTVSSASAISTGVYAGLASSTPTANTVTFTYSVTQIGSVGAQTFSVPVIVQFNANSATAQPTFATAINVLVGYAPQAALTGPATVIPTFAVVASTSTAGTPTPASTITNCQTSLLFPFVTNQLGFDTGIVLANTTTDNLSTNTHSSSYPSSVSAQSGICQLNFYGTGAPTTQPVADPMGSSGVTSTTNANGPVHAFLLSSVAIGFQGYVIATCPFQDAHGFAYIEYDLTQANGVSLGYVAESLTRGASVPEAGISF